jgi:hypothetical protein
MDWTGEQMVTAKIDQVLPVRFSVWPVLLAPIVAGIYYLAIRTAFAQSVVSVLGRSDFFEEPHWGPHWVYRIAADVLAVAFGTFVAAGLASGRERGAAITGGCAIALGFVGKLVITYVVWKNKELDTPISLEPWYQHAIDAAMIPAAPIIGSFVTEAAEQMHRDTPRGFGGINRLHFLWLWLAAYCYALGLVTPVARYYALQDESTIGTFILLLINGIPAAAFAVPAYYGLAFLAGHHGETMYPAGRNLVGILVLVFGFLVGLVVAESWYWLMQTISQVVFG